MPVHMLLSETQLQTHLPEIAHLFSSELDEEIVSDLVYFGVV